MTAKTSKIQKSIMIACFLQRQSRNWANISKPQPIWTIWTESLVLLKRVNVTNQQVKHLSNQLILCLLVFADGLFTLGQSAVLPPQISRTSSKRLLGRHRECSYLYQRHYKYLITGSLQQAPSFDLLNPVQKTVALLHMCSCQNMNNKCALVIWKCQIHQNNSLNWKQSFPFWQRRNWYCFAFEFMTSRSCVLKVEQDQVLPAEL